MKISLRSTFALSAICALNALQAADQPKFEAASVKRTDQCGVGHSVDPSVITLNGFPLTVVLAEAFHVHTDQIVGPSWLEADCFAIVAKVPEGAAKDQIPAMFQALLAERFKLAAHKESRPAPGYALLVDKNGPKFKESDPNSPLAGQVTFLAGPGASGFKGPVTMAFLVRRVSQTLHSPVEDLTGLKGRYDIDVSWRAMEPEHPDSADARADIFTALRDSLGLRLERRKEQVEVLVIDHIERVPTEN
ncbi:MAG: TIGR03435 family protein [Bryobacteraceae bacterium]|jgi:uncharacterized protein (TIGR03435 family)